MLTREGAQLVMLLEAAQTDCTLLGVLVGALVGALAGLGGGMMSVRLGGRSGGMRGDAGRCGEIKPYEAVPLEGGELDATIIDDVAAAAHHSHGCR